MLLLNNVKTSKCCTNGSISIHLMLLLNRILFHRLLLKANFNTSYVVIKRGLDINTYIYIAFQYILCCY